MIKLVKTGTHEYVNACEIKYVVGAFTDDRGHIYLQLANKTELFCVVHTRSDDVLEFALDVFVALLTDRNHPTITKSLFSEYFTDAKVY